MRGRFAARCVVLALLMAAPMTRAQNRPVVPLAPQVDAARPDWENPAVFERGKQPARATGFPFEDRALALAGDRTASKRFLSLNGKWRFAFSPNVDGAPADFYRDDFDVSGWKQIQVPADWQAEGYDQARYNNITYPFPANRPLIPHDRNPVGSYRRDVDVPAEQVLEEITNAESDRDNRGVRHSYIIPKLERRPRQNVPL